LVGAKTAPYYEMNKEYVNGYVVDYIVYYTAEAEELYAYIENDDSRARDTVSFPAYTMVEVGDNYYYDTYLSGVGRVYHGVIYGNGWVIDAAVYRAVKENNPDYKPKCKDNRKDKDKNKGKDKKPKKHKCKQNEI
jgi:hypothetical protein